MRVPLNFRVAETQLGGPGESTFTFILVLRIRARDYRTVFMLNSAEHEVLNAHKYENIKKFCIFQVQICI